MRSIPCLIIIAYSVLFYFVGVLLLAPFEILVNVIIFNFFLVLAFYVRVSNLNARLAVISDKESNKSDIALNLWVLLFFTYSPFFLMYMSSGIPVIGGDIEVDRMLLVNDFGVLYRVAVQAIFFIPPMLVLGYVNGGISKKIVVLVSIVTTLLLMSTGFRSRLVDFIFIYMVSIFAVNNSVFRLLYKNAWKVFPTLVIFLFGAFFFIVYLTSLREGSDMPGALASVFYRIFILNYDVNFNRVFLFVDANGFKHGATFFTDMLSLVDSSYKSMQVEVTQYFNKVNSDLFIMTPTVYGEFYLNFGLLSCFMVFPVVLAYRFVFENIFSEFFRFKYSKIIFFSAAINFIYYIPRQIVTGGVSNAYLIRGLSLIIVTLMVFVVLYMVKVVGRRL